MKLSLQSIAEDPWNRLKVYMVLRMAGEESSFVRRADLLVDLAFERLSGDPAMAFDLCELAIRINPESKDLENRIRGLLSPWLLPRPQPKRARQAAAAVPAVGAVQPSRTLEESVLAAAHPPSSDASKDLQELHELQKKRREIVASIRKKLQQLGIDGFVLQVLKNKGVSADILKESEGFQPNWIGMVQFIDYLRTKGLVSRPVVNDSLEELEQTLLFIEPESLVLAKLKELRSSG